MVFKKKENQEEGEGQGPGVAEAPLPHRFVMLQDRGCERSFVLMQEEEQVLRDGRTYITPGIRISGRPIPGVKNIRIVDLETAPYCTRIKNKFTPDAVAALLLDSPRCQGDNPQVISYDEWQDQLAFERHLAEDVETKKNDWLADQRAKRGKRGA